MEHLIIETPEQIPLELPLAGIGSRFLALALDTLIQFIAALLLVVVGLVLVLSGLAWAPRGGIWTAAIVVLLVFLLQFGYFAFFEAIWNGQTPGKRRLYLRVIKDSGRPITVYDSVARNLLRIVDSIPGIYAVGILSALLSSQNKRLGDFVAGTVVVREKPVEQEAHISWDSAGKEAEKGGAATYDVGRLSDQEFQLMETFLLRRDQLGADVRARMARKISERVAAKLEISADDPWRPEALLETLAAEYRNRSRFR